MVYRIQYLANDGRVRTTEVEANSEDEAKEIAFNESFDGSDGGWFKFISID